MYKMKGVGGRELEHNLLRKGEEEALREFICEAIWSDHNVANKVGSDFFYFNGWNWTILSREHNYL